MKKPNSEWQEHYEDRYSLEKSFPRREMHLSMQTKDLAHDWRGRTRTEKVLIITYACGLLAGLGVLAVAIYGIFH